MIFIMCGIFRSLSRRRRGLSRRRRGRVATRRAAVTVCRGVSRVSRAIFFLSKPQHVLGHPSEGGVTAARTWCKFRPPAASSTLQLTASGRARLA